MVSIARVNPFMGLFRPGKTISADYGLAKNFPLRNPVRLETMFDPKWLVGRSTDVYAGLTILPSVSQVLRPFISTGLDITQNITNVVIANLRNNPNKKPAMNVQEDTESYIETSFTQVSSIYEELPFSGKQYVFYKLNSINDYGVPLSRIWRNSFIRLPILFLWDQMTLLSQKGFPHKSMEGGGYLYRGMALNYISILNILKRGSRNKDRGRHSDDHVFGGSGLYVFVGGRGATWLTYDINVAITYSGRVRFSKKIPVVISVRIGATAKKGLITIPVEGKGKITFEDVRPLADGIFTYDDIPPEIIEVSALLHIKGESVWGRLSLEKYDASEAFVFRPYIVK
jgi:hypothetical protein